MKTNKLAYFLSAVLCCSSITSCLDELDQAPHTETTAEDVYTSVENYKSVLAKLYASLAIGGQAKGDGDTDLDSSTSGWGYLRVYFNMQEIMTDEAVYTWCGGDNLTNIQNMTWGSTDEWVSAMYYRIYYSVVICNEFIRNCSDSKISGFSESEQTELRAFRAEARFLRALVYSHALDMYGNVPFVDESNGVGAFFPERIERADLFDWIVAELKDIENDLPAPLENEYGRASQGAAWTLLARLYLNAQVYTGTAHYDDCATCCNRIISSGYSLNGDYKQLFNADNDLRTNEIIFTIENDGQHTTTWGATTYLVCGSIIGNASGADYGVNAHWGSLRTKREFVNLFDTESSDSRASFFTDGQNLDIENAATESDGYGIVKYTNLKDGYSTVELDADGNYAAGAGSNYAEGLVDTDFPMFRLADVLLMYAESAVRGASTADKATAVGYINALRERAYGNQSGNISANDLSLDFILAERGRELYWECVRRTDLIRFDKLTASDYVWQLKGGVTNGTGVADKYNIFPIPAADLAANPNLIQNSEY